ncbi:hypothetical protein DSO57_1029164 [Entomophthora muscae]|uniref:Uncharacterized protein n=1 Tax=Entomophthora muscae TaxID=34485 RepID=A0ACC2RFZ5_9FUNG|nr:hypothetical protein DSO57_1029164 [Entomophthora muscae]
MLAALGLLLLQVISIYGFQIGTPIPGIHGLGCVTIGNTQYAVGGYLGEEKGEANLKVYSLDLDYLDPPLWKPTDIQLRQGAGYAGITRQGNTNNVLILGGNQIKLAGGFYSIDATGQTPGALQLTSPTFPNPELLFSLMAAGSSKTIKIAVTMFIMVASSIKAIYRQKSL